SVCVVPASTLPISSMTPAACSSRSVSVVLPASTCARIPKFSVLRSKRHTLRIGHKGLLDGHERCAHLGSLVDRRLGSEVKQTHAGAGSGTPAVGCFVYSPTAGRQRT